MHICKHTCIIAHTISQVFCTCMQYLDIHDNANYDKRSVSHLCINSVLMIHGREMLYTSEMIAGTLCTSWFSYSFVILCVSMNVAAHWLASTFVDPEIHPHAI